MTENESFSAFFQRALASPGRYPYDYQARLAASVPCASRLIKIPTGHGKTAAVINAWLWNRVHHQRQDWPRRMVYCLPMRTLVEQTYECAKDWLTNLGCLWDGNPESHVGKVGLHMLMGGESTARWDHHPDENAILIGTQDMLLSRALNRGYGMSRFRWPMHYGLLNNDCLWVFDELQLMGAGLPTTAQLAAFRTTFGTVRPCHTWWMSATSDTAWLRTVDFTGEIPGGTIKLENADLSDERVIQLREAGKKLTLSPNSSAEPKKLCAEILDTSRKTPGLTLVIVNTVKKARELHTTIVKQQRGGANEHPPILLHSQFRPEDRKKQLDELLKAENSSQHRIAISTQIVEAGVDISAATLFSEWAPWSSLVQRFGRCNRRGTEKCARIVLIDPERPAPYDEDQLTEAKRLIDGLIAAGADASPKNLSEIPLPECDKPVSRHVIRRRDFLDLFDTTPDLAGRDIDIDRWVREIEDSSIRLFWRVWEGSEKDQPPPGGEEFRAPQRKELCPAPLTKETRDWLDKGQFKLWRWDHLEGRWNTVQKAYGKHVLIPGQIYLLPSHGGGYAPATGFDPKVSTSVEPVDCGFGQKPESTTADPASIGSWQSIREHTDFVCEELHAILDATGIAQPALPMAARWHDLGKAHPAFAAKVKLASRDGAEGADHLPVGKAPRDAWCSNQQIRTDPAFRPHFRHELASALAILQPQVREIPDDLRNLVAWLVAAHHGKIRLSIRSLPDEARPPDAATRFARGVWDGDPMDAVELGDGVVSPAIKLSLELMEIGLCRETPFENQPSWVERMLELRDAKDLGPLRLAFLETLLRAADERASAKHP